MASAISAKHPGDRHARFSYYAHGRAEDLAMPRAFVWCRAIKLLISVRISSLFRLAAPDSLVDHGDCSLWPNPMTLPGRPQFVSACIRAISFPLAVSI